MNGFHHPSGRPSFASGREFNFLSVPLLHAWVAAPLWTPSETTLYLVPLRACIGGIIAYGKHCSPWHKRPGGALCLSHRPLSPFVLPRFCCTPLTPSQLLWTLPSSTRCVHPVHKRLGTLPLPQQMVRRKLNLQLTPLHATPWDGCALLSPWRPLVGWGPMHPAFVTAFPGPYP